MKHLACCALLMLVPLGAVASQQPSAQSAAVPSSVDKKAEAYTDYILGHISQIQYENTGNQDYAAKAIDYYKKALALDPTSVQIQIQMANTYAESDQLGDAVTTARGILKDHPDNVEAHRLLARIYVHNLGNLGAASRQSRTLALAVEQYEAVMKLDPADEEAGLWLARLYRFQNQPQKAQQVLEQMIERDPANQQAVAQYAQLLLDQGQAQEAIARLSKSAAQSGSPTLYDLLGDAYKQVQDSAHAEQAYRKAVELDPNNPAVVRRLASTLFDENKFDQAIKEYEQLINIDPSNPTSYLRLAEMYYQQKKYEQAAASIAQAKQRAPNSLEITYNEALIDEAMNKNSDAIAALTGAIGKLKQQPAGTTANPRVYAVLYQELGSIYRRQGNYAAAIDTFKQMMALGPNQELRGRLELIQTYRKNNQIDDAIAAARQGMQAHPKNKQMKITYAALLGDKEKTGDAVKVLQSLLDGSTGDRQTYLQISQVELRGRHFADAERAARKAESMSNLPKDQSEAWFLLGAIYERQKKYGPAEQQFEKVLSVNPENAQALNYYGYMLAEEGVRLDQASDLVKRALAIDAGNSAYLDSLGWVYFKQDRLSDARDYLLKAVAHTPNDPTILGHLGDVYQGLGETDQALATWEKALVQWRRVAPADYEADQVHAIERKVSQAKNATHKNHDAAVIPR